MNPKTVLAFALALGVLALSGCTTKVVSAESTALPTVTASGLGKTTASPDTAEMTFGATAYSNDSRKALEEASKLSAAINAAVKDAGVTEEDIQTANVSVYPEYSYEGDKPSVTGYRATVSVRAKIRDMASIGDVIGAASAAGANEINGPAFTLTDDEEKRGEAIELAVADARVRAESMAKAAGKKVGDVLSISEAGVNVPVLYDSVRTLAAGEALAVPIETGELEVTANVTVVFELE